MRAYAGILTARFRMLLQYRASAVAGIVCQVFFGLLLIMLYEAFYRSTTAAQPMALASVVSYVWLGQAAFRLLPWKVEADIREVIRSGNVAYEMLRPVDLYALWYTRALANRSAPVVLRAAPMILLAGLFFGLGPPASAGAVLGYAAAMLGALFLACSISTLMTLTLLWTVTGEGVIAIAMAVVSLFSGIIVPLPLFPDWAQKTLAFMPFRGVLDAPARIYTGDIPLAGLPAVLLHQLIWTVTLVVLGRFVLSLGVRRLVVQGG